MKKELPLNSRFTKDIMKTNIPMGILVALSFYPVLNEGIVSVLAMSFVGVNLIYNRGTAEEAFGVFGYRNIWINTGFYIILVISCLYSDDLLKALDKLQASVILLILPIMVFYFLPKSQVKNFNLVVFGFISANFFLLIYYFNTLVEGLAIDRMPGLQDQGIAEQVKALTQYPYEFLLAKANKHLHVYFESHKVYLSLQFLVAAILALHAAIRARLLWIQRVVLALLTFLFVLAILYTQAITTVIALALTILAAPFIYIKSSRRRIFMLASLVLGSIMLWHFGFSEQYRNKNSQAIIIMARRIVDDGPLEEDIDKRYYILDCAFDVIGGHALTGMGVGDVQESLNACYSENNYVVAEFLSVNSEINTHNYYLFLLAAGGILCLIFFLALLGNNGYLALRAGENGYFLILLVIAAGLFTENLLVRMQGAFLFALFNSIFYLKSIVKIESD